MLPLGPCPQFTLPCSVKWDAMDNKVGRWLLGQAMGALLVLLACPLPPLLPRSLSTLQQAPFVLYLS
jgi:hypothetical protein